MANIQNQKMINFRVFDEGNDLLGIADIQLPSMELLSETVKGAGIAGEFDAPTIGHYASMTLGINFRTVCKEQLNLAGKRDRHLDMRGAIQAYDASTGTYKTQKVKVIVRGIAKKVDLGKLVTAATGDSSIELSVAYLKVEIDGKRHIEIDIFNYIAFVNGEDSLAEVREALGLT